MTTFKPVSVSLCCNNPNTGLFTGSFIAVDIGAEELLNLESKFYPPKGVELEYHFEQGESRGFGPRRASGHITVAGKPFEVIGYKYGWGNWCWDCVVMTPQTAIEFINHLKDLDCFSCDVGDAEFSELWDTPGARFNEKQIPTLEQWGYQAP